MSLARQSLWVLLSSALYCASFPPLGWWPLMWVSVVPLLAVLAEGSPRRAAVVGYAWGLCGTLGVAWWLPRMIADYFERGAWIGWLGLLGAGSLHAGLVYAVAAAWIAWLYRSGRAHPFAIGLVWCGAELVRTEVMGDPWGLIGYAQLPCAVVMQVAAVGGVYGVAFLVVAVDAAVVHRLTVRADGWRATGAATALLAVVLSYGAWQLHQAPVDADASLSVGVVQSGIGRGFRWSEAYREQGVTEHLAASAPLRAAGAQLLVWPEHAVSFYLQEPTPAAQRLRAGLASLGGDIVLGGPHYAPDADAHTKYHNSVFLFHDGHLAGRYDKQHLLPFAETHGATAYTSGAGPGVLAAQRAHLGLLICLEAMFPRLARAAARAGAEVLVNLTNDSWFGAEPAAAMHLAMARVRAIEMRRPLVRAAATGYSVIVDPYGRELARTAFAQAATAQASIAPRSDLTPYAWYGDVPLLLAISALLWWSLRPASRR